MSANETSLPPGFEALEPFVGAWALERSNDRLLARLASREADRVAFFEAAQPRLAEGLAFLDRKPLAALDDQETRLMRLFLGLAHVALAVEVQRDDEPSHAQGARHFAITQAPADR